MNEEQNTSERASDNSPTTGNDPLSTGSTLPPQPGSKTDIEQTQDEYYAVDYAKKDVNSTIGDGEMHNEGLVGEGETSINAQSSSDRLSDEQDEAEMHDSEQ